MSNRTLIELNHDYAPSSEHELLEWARCLRMYLTSGDKTCLPRGATFVAQRNHSEDYPAHANAGSSFIMAANEKRIDDIASIRAAMQQQIDTTDTFSTIADPIDEARLDGMRRMLTVFNVSVRQCESR